MSTLYEHFISMLYCVLSDCTSLREISDENEQEQTFRHQAHLPSWDEEKQRSFEFIINNFELDPAPYV
jgi:hypothetical protein